VTGVTQGHEEIKRTGRITGRWLPSHCRLTLAFQVGIFITAIEVKGLLAKMNTHPH